MQRSINDDAPRSDTPGIHAFVLREPCGPNYKNGIRSKAVISIAGQWENAGKEYMPQNWRFVTQIGLGGL